MIVTTIINTISDVKLSGRRGRDRVDSISAIIVGRIHARGGGRFSDIQFTSSGDIINIRGDEFHNNDSKYESTRDDDAQATVICVSSIDNSSIVNIIITGICRGDNNVING